MNGDPHCQAPDCTNPIRARGLCSAHWNRQARRGSFERLRPIAKWSKKYDACVKCGKTEYAHVGKGHCERCMSRAVDWANELSGRNRRKVLQRYGLTLADYDRLWEQQDGRCAICRDFPPGRFVMRGSKLQHFLHVDHDHDTNTARGLLCSQCNRALGQFRDKPELLVAALAYLDRYGKSVLPKNESQQVLQ